MTQPQPQQHYKSLSDFKEWIASNDKMANFFIGKEPEDPNEKYIGEKVKPKSSVSERKLIERVESADDDPEFLISEFINQGGKVVSIEGNKVHIEVESGEFILPRFCVKIRKPHQTCS